MKAELAAYQAAGMKVTLGLGLQDPPAWALALANGTYVDQTGAPAPGAANLVFSAAVRSAVATYLGRQRGHTAVAVLGYPARRRRRRRRDALPRRRHLLAFTPSALTGNGLPAGMTRNPDPSWKPGTPGLTPAQITAWITWYVGGLDNLTRWEMTTLGSLGFNGYYETLTPGSGTRPDQLAPTRTEPPNDGTTGVGAVWQLYYANLPSKADVIAYISSVADNSGGNDLCTTADDASPSPPGAGRLVRDPVDHPVANQYGLPVAGENPGLNLPASLDTFYTNTTATGMMAAAVAQARSCGFTAFYWAHDVHLWDGTIPFTHYAAAIAPYSTAPKNLAQGGALAPSSAIQGYPAANANDNNIGTYWQAATPAASLTLHLSQAAPVDRVILGLPQNWGTRNQTIEVDGSVNGTSWTTLAPAAAYTFSAGSNAVAIPIPAGTEDNLRLEISGNDVQGVPQIAEMDVLDN